MLEWLTSIPQWLGQLASFIQSLFGALGDAIGYILGIIQFMFSVLQYSFEGPAGMLWGIILIFVGYQLMVWFIHFITEIIRRIKP